nr:class I SAM-dependent methyltransferase [uncultured Roseococcus sp.]
MPAIRRLLDHRERLLVEADSARQALAACKARIAELETKAITTAEEAMRQAAAENRVFITDYPYFPTSRPIEASAGGQQLDRLFRASEGAIADTILGIARHTETLARIPREASGPLRPFWTNSWFPPFDGAALYGLIAEVRPRRFVEVGSGISTRFARQAVEDLGLLTQIVSIDPHPHNSTEGLCDETIVARMEDMPEDFWTGFAPDDMVLIDNSHRSFPGSDVTVFFAEVMPALPAGVVFGIHDIFLPYDYPAEWNDRFYSEQYLLMTYLLGGAGKDQILLPVFWASRQPDLHGLLTPLWQSPGLFQGVMTHGGAFWARRG